MEKYQVMGYMGINIPGHSGAAQKNKKAFSRRNHWSDRSGAVGQSETGGARIVGRYQLQHNGVDINNWLMIALIVLLAGGACWWGKVFTASYGHPPTENDTRRKVYSKMQILDYKRHVRNGRSAFAKNDYDRAVENYVRALTVMPTGKYASQELLQVVRQRCANENFYCSERVFQEDFKREMRRVGAGERSGNFALH